MVVIPSVEEEDLRRTHRERNRLVRERTAHINRIKGLFFGQGIRGINVMKNYKTLAPAELVTGDGRLAIAVNDAEIVLGVGVTLLGGLQIPPRHPR